MSNTFNEIQNLFDAITLPMSYNMQSTTSNAPVDKYQDEDGTWVIEMAVVGKTKEDIKITSYEKDGKTHLKIEAGHKPTEDEKKVTSNRKYVGQPKIKKGYIMVDYMIAQNMDLKNLTAKVSNGLLTIRIPEKAETDNVFKFEIE